MDLHSLKPFLIYPSLILNSYSQIVCSYLWSASCSYSVVQQASPFTSAAWCSPCFCPPWTGRIHTKFCNGISSNIYLKFYHVSLKNSQLIYIVAAVAFRSLPIMLIFLSWSSSAVFCLQEVGGSHEFVCPALRIHVWTFWSHQKTSKSQALVLLVGECVPAGDSHIHFLPRTKTCSCSGTVSWYTWSVFFKKISFFHQNKIYLF